MLVILESFKQYVITFTLPSSSCTVQDLLREMGVEFDERTTIDATEKSEGTFNVVVCVGFYISEATDELVKSTEKVYNEMHQAKKSAGEAAIEPKLPEPTDLSTKPAASEDINGNQQAAEASGSSKKRRHRSSSGNTPSPGTSQFHEQSGESRKPKKHKKRHSSSGKSKDSHSRQSSDRKELPEAEASTSKGNNVSLERDADARKSRKHKKHKKHSTRSSGEKPAVPKDYQSEKSKASSSTCGNSHTSRDNKGSHSHKSKQNSSTDENSRTPKKNHGSQMNQSQKSKESSSTVRNLCNQKFNFDFQMIRSVKSKRSSSLDGYPHTPKENIVSHRLQLPKQSWDEEPSCSQFANIFGTKINEFKPRSAFQSWPAVSTTSEKPKTPEERAELSRLRRLRNWNLSRDCDDDDDDGQNQTSTHCGAAEQQQRG